MTHRARSAHGALSEAFLGKSTPAALALHQSRHEGRRRSGEKGLALGTIPDAEVRYYGDADGLEVDIIVELPDGRWGAFEVKLSEEKVPAAERNVLRLRDKVARNPVARNASPSFLAVLVGKASFCRRTPNGVFVVPITELGA